MPEININDPEKLNQLYRIWYPRGSGSLAAATRTITALIEAIAKEKNITLEDRHVGR